MFLLLCFSLADEAQVPEAQVPEAIGDQQRTKPNQRQTSRNNEQFDQSFVGSTARFSQLYQKFVG
jgi:hypothetical protein